MQGTLATVPVDADYFDISGTEETGTTGSFFKNFTGNYVWVRAVVTYTDKDKKYIIKSLTGKIFYRNIS